MNLNIFFNPKRDYRTEETTFNFHENIMFSVRGTNVKEFYLF